MTVKQFAVKDPEEVDFWNIGFSDKMPSTDSITAIVTVFVAAAPGYVLDVGDDFTIDQFAFVGQVVSGRWQGGTREIEYMITVRVMTAEGRTLDKSGRVFVTDT